MPLPRSASVTTDSLTHYPHVPLYYILSNTVTSDQEQAVHDAVRITPIYYGIVTNPLDTALASRFSQELFQVADLNAAQALALQLYETAEGHPSRSVIIGTANILTAVYADREEDLNVGTT